MAAASKHCDFQPSKESVFVCLCYPIMRDDYWFLVAVYLLLVRLTHTRYIVIWDIGHHQTNLI